MKTPKTFLLTSSILLLSSLSSLHATESLNPPSSAQQAEMARQVDQHSQRSAELQAKSADSVQRMNELHTKVQTTLSERQAREDAASRETAMKWVSTLQLTDPEKASRVLSLVSAHLAAVRDWHNSHPGTAVPEIDPATGKPRTSLERQFIADSAMPKTAHNALMNGLRAELTASQVEAIMDSYTEGKVAFTLKGYKAIVPDLTAAEEAHILGLLKTAREEAIDYKGSKLISRVFETYKTRCEQYLDSNGRSWKKLYKAYTDAVKAKKAAEKQAH